MRLNLPLLRRTAASLPPLPTVPELLKIYQIRAAKQLSQNFLLDQNLCRKLIRCCNPLTNAFVLEVGPGPGCLTRAILEQNPRKLVLIEKDRRFIPILRDLKDAYEAPFVAQSNRRRVSASDDGYGGARRMDERVSCACEHRV